MVSPMPKGFLLPWAWDLTSAMLQRIPKNFLGVGRQHPIEKRKDVFVRETLGES